MESTFFADVTLKLNQPYCPAALYVQHHKSLDQPTGLKKRTKDAFNTLCLRTFRR